MLLMELEWLAFEWDEAKARRNLRERRLPFEAAMLLFDSPVLLSRDRRHEYGEARYIAIGQVDEIELTVVFTGRPERACRIISLRRANRHERLAYRAALAQFYH